MKKGIFLLVFSLVFSACAFEDFDKRSEREAREFTEKQCPRKVDKFTTLDSMIYDIPTRTLEYHYTLSGDLDNDTIFTPGIWADFKNILREELKNSVELKRYKEHKVNFSYCYYSETTKKIKHQADFTAADYTTQETNE